MSGLHAMKSAALDVGARRGFSAQYGGNCISCSGAIAPGDKIFYAPGNEGASGLDCCGDRPDEELTVVQCRDVGLDDEDMTVDVKSVMPHGRTARDACPTCWQIPASNDACGCNA